MNEPNHAMQRPATSAEFNDAEFPPEVQRPASPCNAVQRRATSTNFGDLSPAQLAAVRLLCAGRKVGAVAAELAIHRSTLLRWRGMPAFISEMRRQHRRFTRAMASLESERSSADELAARREQACREMLDRDFGITF